MSFFTVFNRSSSILFRITHIYILARIFKFFYYTIKGKGCHGSTPEKGVDPINIASHVVLGLEGIIAREFNANDPVVITVGKIQGGAQYNIIPETVLLEGTTRTFTEENRQKMAKRIE